MEVETSSVRTKTFAARGDSDGGWSADTSGAVAVGGEWRSFLEFLDGVRRTYGQKTYLQISIAMDLGSQNRVRDILQGRSLPPGEKWVRRLVRALVDPEISPLDAAALTRQGCELFRAAEQEKNQSAGLQTAVETAQVDQAASPVVDGRDQVTATMPSKHGFWTYVRFVGVGLVCFIAGIGAWLVTGPITPWAAATTGGVCLVAVATKATNRGGPRVARGIVPFAVAAGGLALGLGGEWLLPGWPGAVQPSSPCIECDQQAAIDTPATASGVDGLATITVTMEKPGGCSAYYSVTGTATDDQRIGGKKLWVITELYANPPALPDSLYFAKAPVGASFHIDRIAANQEPGERVGRTFLVMANETANSELDKNYRADRSHDKAAYPDILRVQLPRGAEEIASGPVTRQRC